MNYISIKIVLAFWVISIIECDRTFKSISSFYSLEPNFINQISYQDGYQRLQIWDSMKYRGQLLSDVSHTIAIDEISSNEVGLKAIHYLRNRYFSSSNKAHTACKEGRVIVNGVKIYSTRILKAGDIVTVKPLIPADDILTFNDTQLNPTFVNRLLNFTNSLLDAKNTNPPLHVIYEDEQVAVVYKPAGIHSLKWLGTMRKRYFSMDDLLPLVLSPPVNKDYSYLNRPLPCHRLDARVAGCLIVAKTSEALIHLNKQFQSHNGVIKKEYLAVLAGNTTRQLLSLININKSNVSSDGQWSPQTLISSVAADKIDRSSFRIKFPINSRPSETVIKVISTTPCNVYGCLTKVSLYPVTGRRHQLRQHCALLSTPIIGDDLYHIAAYHTDLQDRLDHINKLCNTALEDDEDDTVDGNDILASSEMPQVQPMQLSGINQEGDIHRIYSPIIIPPVRKGVGIFLIAKAIEFEHPLSDNIISNLENYQEKNSELTPQLLLDDENNGEKNRNHYSVIKRINENNKVTVKVSIAEPLKYSQILLKALKGAKWKESLS